MFFGQSPDPLRHRELAQWALDSRRWYEDSPVLEFNYLMTSGKRESDRFAARNVAYSFRGSFGSASANARAFAGRSDRGAVKIEAANLITADPVSDLAVGPALLSRR